MVIPATTTPTAAKRPTAPSSSSAAAAPAAAGAPGGAQPTAEVPIFLQKAYLMIDTCNPKICCWSEDGLTFIVKDTKLFETTIIPQYFKHNKFSSFVRQLNFYGFRKVKFSNSLRIDHKLEAETAKFWRFRHDKFRQGRRDLLIEIKRTPNSSSSTPKAPVVPKVAVPTAALSNPAIAKPVVAVQPKPAQRPEEVTHLKTEMQELRQKIASMTQNIDELTDLVKKVSVKDESSSTSTSPVVSPGAVEAGSKRKKMDSSAIRQEEVHDLPMMPDWNPSSSDLAGVDSLLSGDQLLPDLPMSGAPSSTSSRIPSPAPSDGAFVDELFHAFADEDAMILPGLEDLEAESPPATDDDSSKEDDDVVVDSSNKPCPQLMKRIEASLSTIPRDMHEMVANRLIDAIADSKPIADGYCSSEETVKADRCLSMDEDAAPQTIDEEADEEAEASPAPSSSSIPLPLAVAALKTILAEHGVKVECKSVSNPCKNSVDRARFSKSLPVVPMVPMHA